MTLRTDQQIESGKLKIKSGRVRSTLREHAGSVHVAFNPEETGIVRYLTVGNSARILELCYWSMEPGALEVLRAFVTLPSKAQTALCKFLTTSPDLRSVRGDLLDGKITLSSPQRGASDAIGHHSDAPAVGMVLGRKIHRSRELSQL